MILTYFPNICSVDDALYPASWSRRNAPPFHTASSSIEDSSTAPLAIYNPTCWHVKFLYAPKKRVSVGSIPAAEHS